MRPRLKSEVEVARFAASGTGCPLTFKADFLAILDPRWDFDGQGFRTEAWPWVLASGVTHFFYKFFLASAYAHGDLSRVYPIARGAAPLIVGLVSGLVLSDVITPMEYAGIAVLGAGILLMAQGVFRGGIDPVDLHMSISALSVFNVANRHTFSAIFKRSLDEPEALAQRRDSIIDMVVRFVRA